MRLLLLTTGLAWLAQCQQPGLSDDDSALHFADPRNGRAVWIVDDASLPWIGSYEYLSSLQSPSTVLLRVVDSSTGSVLGECTSTENHGSHWTGFQWALAADSMQCTVSPTNSSRIAFPRVANPRTFSVRIQAAAGPACMREMVVQNEKPIGCPPHLARNRFSALQLACSCPYDMDGSQEQNGEEGEPAFPLFTLGVGGGADPSQVVAGQTSGVTASNWNVSPCANFRCVNNGSCVVSEQGQATCLCPNGFIGATCEVDVCATVPCQNGGICRASGGEAFCECVAGFTGILCETEISAECDPPCANGECKTDGATPRCECKQGFIGVNCNVLDVCLGDAACAMFGDQARCVLDDSSREQISASLTNATYDCHCPHPQSGQFVDCLQLHLATQGLGGQVTTTGILNPVATNGQPTTTNQPTLVPAVAPGFLPTRRVEVSTNIPAMVSSASSTVPVRPSITIHSLPKAGELEQEPTVAETDPPTPFNPSTWPSQFSNQFSTTVRTINPTSMPVVVTEQPTVPVMTHQPTHAVHPIDENTHGEDLPMTSEPTFPTPAPMDLSEFTSPLPVVVTDPPHQFNQLPSVALTSTTEQPVEFVTEEAEENATSAAEETTEDYDETEAETEPTIPAMITSTMSSTTTTEEVSTSAEPTMTTIGFTTTTPEVMESESEEIVSLEVTTLPEVSEEAEVVEESEVTAETTSSAEAATTPQLEPVDETTTQWSLPFWMISSTNVPQVPTEEPEDIEDMSHVGGFIPPTPETSQGQEPDEQQTLTEGNGEEEEELSESAENEMTNSNRVLPMDHTESNEVDAMSGVEGPQQRPPPEVAQPEEKSSAASWIVAIVAVIILGLLALGAVMAILRYVKQSRKLHGKYNPAREEHALSAAYAMPMSHVAKEERLI